MNIGRRNSNVINAVRLRKKTPIATYSEKSSVDLESHDMTRQESAARQQREWNSDDVLRKLQNQHDEASLFT